MSSRKTKSTKAAQAWLPSAKKGGTNPREQRNDRGLSWTFEPEKKKEPATKGSGSPPPHIIFAMLIRSAPLLTVGVAAGLGKIL